MRWKYVHASVVTAATLAGVSGTASAARVDYTIDAGIEQNDNVALSTTDPIDQRYLRGGLGFTITESTSSLQANVDGRVEYRDYEDDIFRDTVDGTLAGRLNWIAIPQRLFFSVEDSLSVQPVDALAPDAPGNRQQVNVFSAGPTLLLAWSPSLHGQAELRYVNSDAEVTDEFNSQRLAAALRIIRELTPTSSVTFNVQGQRVDFDDDIVARDYDRYDLYARYVRTLAHFELGADLGYSRISYRQGGSGTRSEPLIRADATWNPTASSSFTLAASSEFSDTAVDALSGIDADATLPENVLTGDAVVNASPYEVRSLDLGYAYTGTRIQFSVAPFVQERDYIESDEFDQDSHGASADFSWLVRRTLRLGLYAADERRTYTSLNRDEDTLRIGATLRYSWVRHWSVGLQWERYKRDSSVVGEDVSQNIVYLNVTYGNR
ncbi:outer membrane beta-barrel protein [Pseudoxanthomonas sp. UTMC 1351]|uniref:outer membrane beta-barrel protein n=1 Tax=Pseudoxanthomonas sp. UTMC 1351 TaxID=2695853 RepID=UPI0034CE2018